MKYLFAILVILSGFFLIVSHSSGSGIASIPTDSAPIIYLPFLSHNPAVQIPVLKWQRGGCYTDQCQAGYFSSPSVADIDGDDRVEVVTGNGEVDALDGETGSLKWRALTNNRVWSGTVVTDLTGDGNIEIIAGFYNNQFTVYDAAGTPLWSRNPFSSNPEACSVDEIRSLAVADLENDGQFEILVGRAGCGSTRQVSVYEPDGSVRPGWPARRLDDPGHGWGLYNQNLAVGDINNDGFKEVISPSDTLYLLGFDKDGNQLSASSIFDNVQPVGPKVWSQVMTYTDPQIEQGKVVTCGYMTNFADSPAVLSDLDNNGSREVIVIASVQDCGYSHATLYHIPFIFNFDRSRWMGSGFDWNNLPIPDGKAGPLPNDPNLNRSARPDPAVADLDGDGFREILYPSYDGRLHAYWLDKTEHGSWPFSVYNPAEGFVRFASEPAVADLNNDGKAEVIFTDWPQEGTNQSGKLYILNYLGEKLFEVILPPAVRDDWNGSSAAPTLANIDADADLEVLIQTSHSGVVAYDLPGTANAKILWGTGRGDFLRDGTK